MKSSSFAITLLFAKVTALSLRRADAGVPVTVNPTLMNNTMGDVPLGLNMTVGPDQVQVSQQKLAQGVPVHVVPTLMTDTMHDAKLDMKIVVGPDEVELKKKQSLAQGPPVLINPTKATNEMESASMELPGMKVGGNTVTAAQIKGVPVFVNPTKATNEMESASMELPGMKVGGNTVTAAQVKGVPVHVVPTLMTDTMHDAKLDMKIVVGPDEVELKKKQQLAQGVPVHVVPTLMTDTMHDAKLDMKIVVGPDEVELKKKQQLAQGVPVHVVPTLMTDTMHDAKLDMKIVVGPDEVELKKKQLQQLVQQSSKKYSDMKEGDLEAVVKKALLAEPPKAKDAADAKKTVDDMKAVEDALGKRILDRLSGYGWQYGYPLYPYVPYGSTVWTDVYGVLNPYYAYHDLINRYETANAIAGYAAPGIYDSLKGILTPPAAAPADKPAAAPAAAKLIQFEDNVVLQLNGVPVSVNPETMMIANTQAATSLGLNIRMGPDDVSFKKSQKQAEHKLEDNVVLQVFGVPVTVNPESMIIASNTEASTNLGLANMEIGPDEVSVVQKKASKDIDDKEMKDSISQFNSKLVELKKRFKF